MSNFRGRHALVMLLPLCFIIFSLQSPATAAGGSQDGNGDWFESLSRKEMVQMAGYGEEKLSTVLVTGSVLCEAPNLHGHLPHQTHAWPIPGASVVVNCHSDARQRKGKSTVAKGVTDEFGDFIIDIPSHLHGIPNLEKICTLKLHRLPRDSLCHPASVKRHTNLRLSTFGNGIRTYSAGNLMFQHSTSKPLHA